MGKGPGEVPITPSIYAYEESDVLYAVSENIIYRYKLSSGEFIGNQYSINLNPGEQLNFFRVINDSDILYSCTTTHDGCSVRMQDLNGNIPWQKHFDFNSWYAYGSPLGGNPIYILSTHDPEKFILQFDDQDTLYEINTKSFTIRLTLIVQTDNEKTDGYPAFSRVNGYQFLDFLIYDEYVFDEQFLGINSKGNRYFIIYDDNKKRGYRIGNFYNDYLGFKEVTAGDAMLYNYLHFPNLQDPEGKMLIVYNAYEFLDRAEETLADPDLDPDVRQRLLQLTEGLTEDSNPILVIGDMKKEVDL